MRCPICDNPYDRRDGMHFGDPDGFSVDVDGTVCVDMEPAGTKRHPSSKTILYIHDQ